MSEVLEVLKPFVEIVVYAVIIAVVGVWQNRKGKIKDVALKAVKSTEQAFIGIHDKSEDKKAHAIGLIAKQFPFVSEKTATQLINFALSEMEEYATAQLDKGIEKVDSLLNPNIGGE
jgi:hypothetical protein